ncbi:MAG: hypothetical protein RJA49_3098 [Actinomycetota bacterium]
MFDRIVVVDWSANGAPKRGADSIWVCTFEPGAATTDVVNHPTRRQARDALVSIASRPGRTLLGFDFPLGHPIGFAASVGLSAPAWSSVWAHLAEHVHDDERNRNDRWSVAREWNRTLGRPHFWGAPPRHADPDLTATKPPWTDAHLPTYRIAEARLRSRRQYPFSVWQLLGAGSVGSQALTGIPVVHHLRHHVALRDRARVWPFETGLVAAPAMELGDAVVIAEVWPSAIPFDHVDHPVKDARQVTALVHHLGALDAADALGPLFAPTLTASDAAAVVAEEGWVLGLD